MQGKLPLANQSEQNRTQFEGTALRNFLLKLHLIYAWNILCFWRPAVSLSLVDEVGLRVGLGKYPLGLARNLFRVRGNYRTVKC